MSESVRVWVSHLASDAHMTEAETTDATAATMDGKKGMGAEVGSVVHRSRKQPHTTKPSALNTYHVLGLVYSEGNKCQKQGT